MIPSMGNRRRTPCGACGGKRTIMAYRNVEECLRLAENLTTAPDVLVELAKHCNCRVRAVVAENMNTPPDTLTWLAKDPDLDVRWDMVAGGCANLNTPPDTLTWLAKDPDWKVRWAVAQNLNSTPAVLALLEDDEHEMVRWAVTKSRSRSV